MEQLEAEAVAAREAYTAEASALTAELSSTQEVCPCWCSPSSEPPACPAPDERHPSATEARLLPAVCHRSPHKRR